LPYRAVREIRYPQLIRGGRSEITFHKIRCPNITQVGPSRPHLLTTPRALYPCGSHQPPATIRPDSHILTGQLSTHFAVPVTPVIRYETRTDLRCQLNIINTALRRRSDNMSTNCSCGHLQHLTDGIDPELFTTGLNKRSYRRDWRQVSAPKKDAAAFKISFAGFVSRNSFRKERTSDSNSLTVTALRDDTSVVGVACLHHPYNVAPYNVANLTFTNGATRRHTTFNDSSGVLVSNTIRTDNS
jgi:hypothetical protein